MRILTLVAALMLAVPALAADVVVHNPVVRATMAGKTITAAYVRIENTGKAGDRLLSVTSPVAGRVELHGMRKKNGVMEMYPLRHVMIPGGRNTVFKPGDQHVMLFDLTQPLKAGNRVPLTLTFKKAGAMTVEAMVVTRPDLTTPPHQH